MDREIKKKLIGKYIRQRREGLGLSLENVGDKLGISYQQVQKYETGLNSIVAERLPELAEILQCSTNDILQVINCIENDNFEPPKHSTEALQAAELFSEIKNPKLQKMVLSLMGITASSSKNV